MEVGAGHSGKAQLDWMVGELLLILTWDRMLSAGMAMGPQNGPHTLKVQRDGGRTDGRDPNHLK